MDYQTFFLLMAAIGVGMAWWANWSKRNKVYCSFTDVDKTGEERWVKKASRYVVFKNRRYNIVPSCVKSLLWNRGIVGFLFPQRVQALDYTWSSEDPIDPNTGKPVIISAEVRQAMNKEEWVKSYARGFTPPSAKKQTMLQQWLPWVTVGLVVLMFFYVYTNNQAFSQAIMDLANRINALAK